MTEPCKTDTLIFGGGIAGLWLLNRLRNEGYDAWLLEQDNLGAGQSIASQGMIHGGIKYALGGKLTGASNAIADMPAFWKSCLQGTGDVDLRACDLLSEYYYMWPARGIRSRFHAFLGSKTLEARVSNVGKNDFPAFFRGHISGPLYRLQDIVLDVPSLLYTLSTIQQQYIYRIDWRHAEFRLDENGKINGLQFFGGPLIQAQRYVFCCGAGAEALMNRFNLNIVEMQRRPLQMVMVKHRISDPVYVHCVSDKLTMTPEITVTSHRNQQGEPVWYLGGELAEQGAAQSPAELIGLAGDKLARLFPWCDFSEAVWDTLFIDRAEAKQKDGKRPDDISITAHDNLLVCWPTKLTLAPNLAAEVIALFRSQGISAERHGLAADLSFLERPAVASTPWEHL